MSSSSNNNKKFLVSAAVAAVALGAAYLAYKQSKSKKDESSSSSEVLKLKANEPSVSRDTLIAVFESITSQMSQVVIQLAKIEQKVRQESAAAGKELPEDSLGAYLMQQFEEAMKAVESQVYSKHQCTEEEVQLATEYYSEDDKVKASVLKLRQLFSVITGQQAEQSLPPVPDDMTLEKLIGIMEETMEAMNQAMEETCDEIKTAGIGENESIHSAINQTYVKKADEVSVSIHQKYGINREILQSAMIKYQQDPAFLNKMQELQTIQAERFQAAAASLGDKYDLSAGY